MLNNTKKYRLILYIITIIQFFFNNSIFAQNFIQSDIERLINNHPLMKNFDKKTGHFHNPIDKKQLETEISSITKELEKTSELLNLSSNHILSLNEENEDETWKNTSTLEEKKKLLEKQLEKSKFYLSQIDEPNRLELVKTVDKLTEEIILPLYEKNKIIFNKFPKSNFGKPQIDEKDLRRFFYSQDKEILNKYLDCSYLIGLMFKQTDNIIIFTNEKCKSNKIALIDLSKILALHPKMALFDFQRFGFYKLKKCNLPEEEFYKEINNLLQTSKFDESKIKEIDLEIEKNRNENNLKNINKEKELIQKKNRIIYELNNTDITNLEDTKNILKEIELEILEIISNIAIKSNIETVINNNYLNFNFSEKLRNDSGKKIENLLSNKLFYNFLSDVSLNSAINKASSSDLLQWLECLRNPIAINTYYYNNSPFVIYSNNVQNSLNYDILKELYEKYSINHEVLSIIDSELTKKVEK